MSDKAPVPSGRLLVSGCDVLRVPPVGECEILPAQDIVVVDGAIEDVRPTGEPTQTYGAQVVDGRGLLAVRGLVNAHTHSPMVLMRGAAEDVTVEGWFNDRVWPMESNLTPDVRVGALLACAEMVRCGVTIFLAAVGFGAAEALAVQLGTLDVPPQLVSTIPYAMTLVALAAYAWRRGRTAEVAASL